MTKIQQKFLLTSAGSLKLGAVIGNPRRKRCVFVTDRACPRPQLGSGSGEYRKPGVRRFRGRGRVRSAIARLGCFFRHQFLIGRTKQKMQGGRSRPAYNLACQLFFWLKLSCWRFEPEQCLLSSGAHSGSDAGRDRYEPLDKVHSCHADLPK